jgi:hypothetical protein
LTPNGPSRSHVDAGPFVLVNTLLRVARFDQRDRRVFRRAAAGTFALLIAASVLAYADTVPADGHAVTPGNQTLIDVGHASPDAS